MTHKRDLNPEGHGITGNDPFATVQVAPTPMRRDITISGVDDNIPKNRCSSLSNPRACSLSFSFS